MTSDPRIYVAIRPDEFALLFPTETASALKALGTVEFADGQGKVPVPDDVADAYDVLVTSWSTEPFPQDRLHGPRLRLAVHAAGSVRGLFARDTLGHGLRLAQGGADGMAVAVAEMAVTLTLVILRNVHTHDRALQASRDWVAGGTGRLGRSVHAQRVGIVGLSRTGIRYARMMRGLGVSRLAAYDPFASADLATTLGVRLVGLDELCRTSDVLSLHAPSTPATHRMIGADQLRALPDDAVVVNTARSWVVDESALLAELRTGRISAGLDVFDTEPLPPDSPFFGLPNAVLLPHVAGGTVQARHRQGEIVVEEVARFLRGEELRHEVTPENYDRLA
ncbi:hydroxyacid dehydrogenase [Saccharomonospora azurea]|uniref:hydroxyacid dehydrogenase n=1 Tax=Saccharomonospora azurea TaxID=40988 RepID=UPI003D90001E